MTILPIVARELRVASRRRVAHWNRVVAALLALGVGGVVYASFARSGVVELGLALFVSLAWLAFLFAVLAGARLTSDAVSEERREGTLGLLFLTDLKGHDIVFGKLAASSLNALYSLLAIVPILGLALLFGGVSGKQFWQSILALVNTMLFSLALGIWVSTWFENGRRAAAVTVVLLLLVTLGPLLVLGIIGARYGPGATQNASAVLIPSPGLALALAAVPGAPPPLASLYWASLGTTAGLTLVCLVLSSVTVPRVWHDQPVSSRRLAWRQRRAEWAYGVRAAREAFRRRLLAANAFFWLTSRDRLRPWYVWAVFVGAALVWVWGRSEFGADWEDPGVLLTLSQCLYGVLKLWIAAAVVTRLAEDRRSAALELLLTTPVRLRDLRMGLLYSLRRQFLWPLVVLVGLDLLLARLAALQFYGDRNMMLGMYASRLVLLVLDVVTLWALGPWVAVKARHPNQAAAHLLLRVCVLPWLVFIVLTITVGIAAEWRLVQWNLSEYVVLATWFALGLFNDLGWLVFAWTRSERAFREAAAARFDRSRPWWRLLWPLG